MNLSKDPDNYRKRKNCGPQCLTAFKLDCETNCRKNWGKNVL